MPYDKFQELIANQDMNALDYFSMEEAYGVIHYASYTAVVTSYDGVETDRAYMLQEYTMTYQSITNLCSMPTNFLFNLLQESGNPEYVMSVIDLLLENTELVVMIQDELETSTYTHEEIYYNAEKIEKKYYEKKKANENTVNEYEYWSFSGSDTEYKFPVGDAIIHTTVVKTYANIATVFIQKANTWCLDFEQEAVGSGISQTNPEPSLSPSDENKDMPKNAQEYGLKSDMTTYKVEGITKSYNIAWISDIHSVINCAENWGDIKEDQKSWIQGRYDMFVSDDGSMHSKDTWNKAVKYLNEGGFDAVIFGGDLLDYYSADGYQMLSDSLSALNIPYVFIYGGQDHDADGSRVDNADNALGNIKSKVNTSLDLDEIRIVGVLNSADRNSTEVSATEGLIDSSNKPVLVATHVPFDGASDNSSLELWSKSIHNNQKYYWARSDSSWIIQNNSAMESFLNNYIYNTSSKVFGVVAGHVHTGTWEGNLTDKVKEHIFPAAYRGYVGTIRIEPEGESGGEQQPQVPANPSYNGYANYSKTEGTWIETNEDNQPEDYPGYGYELVSEDTTESGDSRTVTSVYRTTNPILYKIREKTDFEKYWYDIVVTTEKRINYEKFLGLWKNDTGEYYLGSLFDEQGKKVKYKMPDTIDTYRYPVNDISKEQGQNIHELVDLLAKHDDTQTQELLMMYYWNIYEGKEVYKVDLDALLSLFDVSTFYRVGRWKRWRIQWRSCC